MSTENENKLSFSIIAEIFRNSARVGKIIWEERKGQVIALCIISLFLSVMPFLNYGSSGLLINELVKIAGNKEVGSALLLFLGLYILTSFAMPLIGTLGDYFSKLFWFFLGEKFEMMLIKKKGDIDVAVHEDPKQNDLFHKVSEAGIWRIQNFSDRQFMIFENIISVIAASLVLTFSNWWVFLIILIGAIPDLIIEARYGQQNWGIQTAKAEVRRKFWNLRGHFNYLPNLIELKLFQNIKYFLSSIKELFRSYQEEEKKNEKKKFIYRSVSLMFAQAIISFAIIWFVFEVVKGHLLIGTLTFILSSVANLRRSLSGLFQNLGRQYEDNLFATDVFKLLDIEPAVIKPEKGIVIDTNKTPEIIFDNVTFAYPDTNKSILKNFSLKIPAGEKVALVGINGAGKTTIVKLLCRFYDTDKGKITINGHDLKDIDLESWYHQVGVLFQDYSGYHFIVKEAIAIGRTSEKLSIEKVKEAAKASEADVFIEEWEKNYEQHLGKQFTGGIEPSIGQWQKLALARTFYRDPKILILDEPTSSIDAEAEAKIFERLEALPKDRTVILISHRFSTVRRANHIAVIEKGTVKEFGTHNQLLKLKGTYAKLFKLQAKGYQ